MVNFGLNAAAILGLFLAVAGAGLFFLRSIRPELARDYDIFFAAVGLLCGIILLFNGWRLDPILQFGQFLLTGTAIFFAFESIRMRSVATEQARRNTPIVDRDRPVSRTRVYTEAELDKIDPYDDYDNVYEGAKPNYNSPRLRGYDDPQPRPSRRPSERRRPPSSTSSVPPREEPRRRPAANRPEATDSAPSSFQGDRYGYPEPDNRPRRPSAPTTGSYDDWNDSPRPSRRPSRPRPRVEERYTEPPAPRRPSPAADLGRSYEPEDDYSRDNLAENYSEDLGRSYEPENETPIPGDYVVDYQPVEESDSDYGDNYDDYRDQEDKDYDNYEEPEVKDPGENYDNYDNYDNYRDRPEPRKPIDFGGEY